MNYKIRNFLLLVLTTFVIFYLIVVGINLGLRLTATQQPECEPLFCKQLADEASYCLISTPGAESCLKVAGYFFVPSLLLAYSLLFTSLGLAFVISKKFYLSRWLIILGSLAMTLFFIRIALGAATLSPAGFWFEFEKLGLIGSYTDMLSREI